MASANYTEMTARVKTSGRSVSDPDIADPVLAMAMPALIVVDPMAKTTPNTDSIIGSNLFTSLLLTLCSLYLF